MTPPASATTPHAARPTRRRPPQRPPRRVSGPARRPRTGAPGAVAVAPPLGLRLARAGGRIVDARFLDRLLRGRVWIALLALGLMGIVFIQVSMLRLNAGISRGITSAETLQRQNATLRGDISQLDASARIADAAKSFGMIQPGAGSVHYLDARKANGAAAARGIRAPKAAESATTTSATTATTSATTATTSATTATTTAAAAQTTAPPAQTTTAAQSTAPPPTTTQAQAATTPPVQQQPVQQQPVQQQPVQQQPVQQQQAQQQAQPPAAVTPAGGVTTTGTGGQ